MNWPLLLAAIATVESGGKPLAVGDGGKALGMYQIHAAYVADVNRILGCEAFEHRDALIHECAERMVRVYLGHYARRERIGGMSPMEAAARIHNGGPNGHRKESTQVYWTKVKGHL